VGFTEEPATETDHIVFSPEELGRAIRAAAGLHDDEKKAN
jgi:hypothetical protein